MEKEKEAAELIHHFSHRHPFCPISESRRTMKWCIGCLRYFLPGEAAYGCSVDRCWYYYCLHEECLEMPREIMHPVHPSHPLTHEDLKKEFHGSGTCAVCEEPRTGVGYICSQGCKLLIHFRCVVGEGVDVNVGDEEKLVMNHPSHLQHELRFLGRKEKWCSFRCDACGTTEKGNSYICSICQYWIHESCARLPDTASFPHHHPDHPLSLAFRLPLEYSVHQYACDICKGSLRLKQWVYHCQRCRYVVHIKCATNTSPAAINNEDADDDPKGIIQFPINDDGLVELISALVVREEGENKIVISQKHQFHNHHNPLKLIMSASPSSSHYDDDDDDGDIDQGRLELSCDGCTMPIHEKSCSKYYMSCGECKYFLHSACFNLPPHLPSHPLHPIQDHYLVLRKPEKLTKWASCQICNLPTNGLYYGCTKSRCYFKLDIKCASLPHTIKHAAHPKPHHYLKLIMGNQVPGFCGACYGYLNNEKRFYRCDSCSFGVCWNCVLLPATNKHRLEKHLLSLTYDAHVNHPDEFYCGSCELRMIPKSWMYHCRDCDQSFHPKCFPATSGKCRNINFGSEQYVSTSHNPHHTLKFQIITKKKALRPMSFSKCV